MKPAHKLLFENNLHQSHWGLRIIAGEIKGRFSEVDIFDSNQWMSCACGKLDGHIEREKGIKNKGCPKDRTLFLLGHDFNDYVHFVPTSETISNGQFYRAARTLIAIEQRSIELLVSTKR
jgi:hypothetical protein